MVSFEGVPQERFDVMAVNTSTVWREPFDSATWDERFQDQVYRLRMRPSP